MIFQRTKNAEGISTYTFSEDPRFSIVAETRQGSLGVGPMVFGNYAYGDGSLKVTGWHIEIQGSRKHFAPGKLAYCKARIQDPEFRAWALGRAS